MGIASIGYSMGWTSPINIKLQDEDQADSPLPAPLDVDQTAWVGSLLPLGAIFGPFVVGVTVSKIGRKWTLLSSAIPLIAGWILVATASNVGFLYSGRILWGIAVGMLFTVTPIYCGEIATDDVRGALGSFLQVFITFGYLFVYGIGPFVTYGVVAYVGLATVLFFVVCFYFMPESPMYHLVKDDRESAAKCLMTIRGRSRVEVEAELDKMATEISASMEKTATLADVFRGSNFKGFYICCVLLAVQQFSGIGAVLFYMNTIFGAAGSELDPSIATIVVGAVQVLASMVTPLVVDRLGRRILLLISTSGTATGLVLLGTYFLLNEQNSPVIPSIGFLPILSLVVFIVAYCWGVGPLPFAIMGEMFPIEVKAVAAPLATTLCWTLCFLITRYFEPVAEAVGMYVAFWVLAAACVLGFFFTLFLVPETKGKSLQEIQDMLAGRKSNLEKA
ncbi:unnamed protein product, partial [Iphiclides podalirius]